MPATAASTPLPPAHETVVHMLREAVRLNPDGQALVCGANKLSYRQYGACVAGLARELVELGVAGQRVCLLMGNSLDIAIATFAVQAGGGQVVPLNPAYTAHELSPILENATPDVVIHDASLDPGVTALFERLNIDFRIAVGGDARSLTEWRDQAGLAERIPLPRPDALATLQYTGGTTGRPKGVDLSHRALAINVAQREALLPTEAERERVLAITPLYHVYAVSMGLYLSAYCRGALVILPRYQPDLVLDVIARERITLLSGSPTIYTGLLAHERFAAANLSSLRLCFSGTAALSEDILRRWEAATGCPICEGYGQSEAGPVLTFNPRHGRRKVGSVGIAVPATDIDIVDPETGARSLPPGEAGEIRARGPQIMNGYRGLPQETAEALRGGWLYTGDIGVLDEDGYLFIRDRKKDMAIVSGFNVYPREVEEALHAHPEILEAAVIGRPDAYRGETLIGFVVLRRGQESATLAAQLRAHLAERLVKYKLPQEIKFVQSLPKTPVGKVDKNRLREAVRSP